MKSCLRTKLIASFVVVVLISGLVATLVGVRLIAKRIVEQAQNNVRMDLNSAREVYEQDISDMKKAMTFTVLRDSIKNALAKRDREPLANILMEVRDEAELDVLTITDSNGCVVVRSRNPEVHGDSQIGDEVVRRVLSSKEVIAGTAIMPQDELLKEGEDLAQQAHIGIIPTPMAKPRPEKEETSGMMMKAAAPILDDDGNLLGALYGGKLLNRNYGIVDKVKDILYKGEKYKEKDIGTATIFQQDLRISTNVLKDDGSRAIGTRVSEAVYDEVLVKEKLWIARAFVVNDWYITAYEPIRDVAGKVIGILYVGLLEQKFTDIERETTLIFLGVTFAGIVLALVVSYFLADSIVRPVRRLVAASEEIARGNLSYRVELDSKDEIGELGKTFNFMAFSLKERDEQLRASTEQQLLRSEKLASLGRLAAGVAHEINNPLTGVLTFGHLLLRKSAEGSPEREDLQTIVNETVRCKHIVKGLLDFARQTEPHKVSASVNDVLEESLLLTENQALLNNVKLVKELSKELPDVMMDKSQIQQVFINILLNAIDAMQDGGTLAVATDMIPSDQFMEVRFADTGCGIAPTDIGKVFDPFFTTKDTSRGTGLGLAVSYGIVERHGGTITVRSRLGEGSIFTVKLPVKE